MCGLAEKRCWGSNEGAPASRLGGRIFQMAFYKYFYLVSQERRAFSLGGSVMILNFVEPYSSTIHDSLHSPTILILKNSTIRTKSFPHFLFASDAFRRVERSSRLVSSHQDILEQQKVIALFILYNLVWTRTSAVHLPTCPQAWQKSIFFLAEKQGIIHAI